MYILNLCIILFCVMGSSKSQHPHGNNASVLDAVDSNNKAVQILATSETEPDQNNDTSTLKESIPTIASESNMDVNVHSDNATNKDRSNISIADIANETSTPPPTTTMKLKSTLKSTILMDHFNKDLKSSTQSKTSISATSSSVDERPTKLMANITDAKVTTDKPHTTSLYNSTHVHTTQIQNTTHIFSNRITKAEEFSTPTTPSVTQEELVTLTDMMTVPGVEVTKTMQGTSSDSGKPSLTSLTELHPATTTGESHNRHRTPPGTEDIDQSEPREENPDTRTSTVAPSAKHTPKSSTVKATPLTIKPSNTTILTTTTTTTAVITTPSFSSTSTKAVKIPITEEQQGTASVLPPKESTNKTKNIIEQGEDYVKTVVKKLGPGKTAGVIAVILFATMLLVCCLCRCSKRRKYGRLGKLKRYEQEKDFLLNDREKGKYQSDRLTLLDETSEDEF